MLDRFAEDGYDLVLAGHTHGGQLCVPFYGAIVTNCELDRSRVKGPSRWGAHTQLHVSAGIGTSPYAPARFCCRPEATLLTLIPREPEPELHESAPQQGAFAHPTSGFNACRLRAISSPRFEHGVWRSLVARFVRDEEVVGSNPATPTVKNLKKALSPRGEGAFFCCTVLSRRWLPMGKNEDFAHNDIASRSRREKAVGLAKFAWNRGITAAELLDMPDDRLRKLARAADANPAEHPGDLDHRGRSHRREGSVGSGAP